MQFDKAPASSRYVCSAVYLCTGMPAQGLIAYTHTYRSTKYALFAMHAVLLVKHNVVA
jgi:hypothetical protein